MNKTSLSLLCTSILLLASPPAPLSTGNAVVPNDKTYYTDELVNGVQIIYTKDNEKFANETAAIEIPLNKAYEKTFGWKFDEQLHVGLISDYNQIANGFSTQLPYNRQINYIGGTELVDYFSVTSWLDTLIYHETAHNYQINVKGSVVSQGLHSIIGNSTFILPIVIPNVVISSFMLEGNAVLNESWHGNGGRLFSGRLRAQTVLQAEAGNINPAYSYNEWLQFPYREKNYIQGGFYNEYMADKYGLDTLNKFFKNNSLDWYWPFRTNEIMKKTVGETFEKTLNDFAKIQKVLAQDFVQAQGEPIAVSQFFSSLGNSQDEVFFVINEDGRSFPDLVVLNKTTKSVTKNSDSWNSAKVLKVDANYYTQGSANTSPTKIQQGLFNEAMFIKDGTESKMVQAYLSNGDEVYFDVPSSYAQPQLYVEGEFYRQVNSSVIVDKDDNLYYFVQKGKNRTLYKNKTPLYSFSAYYGIVCDVDSKGGIYFVANSKLGSTLYKYQDKKVSRVSNADNIVEARLVNDTEVLIGAISDKEYYYVINKLTQQIQTPFDVKYFFEDKEYYGLKTQALIKPLKTTQENEYNALLDMHYSGSSISLGTTNALNIKFGDPLAQNSANIFISQDNTGVTIAGVGYSSALSILKYNLITYGVLGNNDRSDTRNNGIIASASLPLYQAGFYNASVGASYFQDYDTLQRKPISATLTLSNTKQFGVSMYTNSSYLFELYGVSEREDKIAGGIFKFNHELIYETYIGFGTKYSSTDREMALQAETRGIKITPNGVGDMDPSTISIPSIPTSYYLKSAGYMEANLAKVFNLSAYFFTFPLSVQRESITLKYRHYRFTGFSGGKAKINEATLGLRIDTVIVNKLPVSILLDYVYNDADEYLIKDRDTIRFKLSLNL
ncbi:hypothetical protein JHD49_06665 [Sulfurimonas sp. SAG-AH-194-C21]|nr:hypothetical protein [Sulfurimonas sp. SAG-AH-194-C21]MDF1883616.1 hypothetical protein [Sulfurimonas sp. SAG-AH-194-C21]